MVVHRLLPKAAKHIVLLITSDAPMTTGITCVSLQPDLFQLIFSTVFLIS